MGHFVSSPREREKRDRRVSRGDKGRDMGRKREVNESEETGEIKTFPLQGTDEMHCGNTNTKILDANTSHQCASSLPT